MASANSANPQRPLRLVEPGQKQSGVTRPSHAQTSAPQAEARLAVGQMTLEQAIFFLEHPGAVRRDVADADMDAFYTRLERLVADARSAQPLAWQAHEARRRRVAPVGTGEAARRIVGFVAAGGRVGQVPAMPR